MGVWRLLPLDMRVTLLRRVPLATLAAFARVCHAFHDVARSEILWMHRYLDDFSVRPFCAHARPPTALPLL